MSPRSSSISTARSSQVAKLNNATEASQTPAGAGRPETAKARKLRERIARDRSARAMAAQNKPDDLVSFELPEVEMVRKELNKQVVGLKVKSVEAQSMKCLRSYFARKYFTQPLEGAEILSVGRLGLYITVELSTDSILVMSLGASGSPRRHPTKTEQAKNTEVVITFTQDGQLHFVDAHGTGQLFVVPADELHNRLPETASYGHDPLEPLSWTDMGQLLLKERAQLRSLLTDDEFMVGIGDIYVDEILFEAGLRYDRPAYTLTGVEIRRLYQALRCTIFDAMKYGGTSVECRPFINTLGKVGAYGSHLKVWGRHGMLSPKSRTPIQRKMYCGSWTYFCKTQV